MPATAPAQTGEGHLGRLFRFLAAVALINTGIAVMLTLLVGRGNFATNLLHSQAIGLSVYLLMYGPLTLLRGQTGVRRWAWLGLCALAIPAGFVIGFELSARLMGMASPLFNGVPGYEGLGGFLVLTVIVSVGCGLFFWQRGQVAALAVEAAQASERASVERMRAEAASHQAMEARFALLRAQLEPHMLFNTLANVRTLIAFDPVHAQAMMDRLIAWLRATLSASRRDTVSLADEFALLHDYLLLIAMRMGPRLQFRLDLPEELNDWAVPALLLQPLVENAVRHGLEPLVEGGVITVTASRHQNGLRLVVEDTGAGFAAKVAPAGDAGTMDASSGFGQTQVRQRLSTLYGDRAGLTIDSPRPDARDPDQPPGTRITIDLPRDPGSLASEEAS